MYIASHKDGKYSVNQLRLQAEIPCHILGIFSTV